jgi:ribonuclease HII
LLTPSRREELYDEIMEKAISVSVSFVDAHLIDIWGLQAMNLKALGDAILGLDPSCECAICDNYKLDGLGIPSFGIPMADSTFQSVAAASIVAKVERDRVMLSLHARYPQYNFEYNKGYATPEHLKALELYGPSDFHRLTFRGVLREEAPLWE